MGLDADHALSGDLAGIVDAAGLSQHPAASGSMSVLRSTIGPVAVRCSPVSRASLRPGCRDLGSCKPPCPTQVRKKREIGVGERSGLGLFWRLRGWEIVKERRGLDGRRIWCGGRIVHKGKNLYTNGFIFDVKKSA